jgi:hypothetical protein
MQIKHYILLNKSDIISVGAGVDYNIGKREKKELKQKKARDKVTSYPAFKGGKTPPIYHILDSQGRKHALRILENEGEGYQKKNER